MLDFSLVFKRDRIQRSTTREEWRKQYRWLRQVQKILLKEMESKPKDTLTVISNIMTFGHTRL